MAQTKLFGKDLSAYQDIDLDALLATLNEEELEELGQELIDPDDSCIPPSERCRYRTTKEPTGPFNRKHLLDFLENKAKEEKDWEEIKPYIKEIRGKVWKPKDEEKVQIAESDEQQTEWDEVLANATEEELVDLAAILGFHGMLNQVQYHQAFVENKTNEEAGGFRGVAKHEDFKLVPDEPPNTTDVEGTLQKLTDNDPETKEVNLNNIKRIPLNTLMKYADTLKSNTNLEKLEMANVKMTDRVAIKIGEALKENKTLQLLNIESNYVSGEGIIAVLEGINQHQVVQELRVTNQRPQVIGVKKEMRIAELCKENKTLKRFGIFIDIPSARIKVQDAIERNNDEVRKERVGTEHKED